MECILYRISRAGVQEHNLVDPHYLPIILNIQSRNICHRLSISKYCLDRSLCSAVYIQVLCVTQSVIKYRSIDLFVLKCLLFYIGYSMDLVVCVVFSKESKMIAITLTIFQCFRTYLNFI